MGWNSYDTYGDSVTEAEVLANAAYMRDHLKSHGWQFIVVDYRWYDPGANSGDLKKRARAPLTMDRYGRLTPAVNRFPSAADGKGFTTLAADIHSMGLKFGIHVMRGIPRIAVKANLPIEGSPYHTLDAADLPSICGWNPDMFGVDGASAAGQAYYDSLLRLYASWGVDFIKVDDLSQPYSTMEIEDIRRAIDKCGRPIVLSLSPGETPIAQADHVKMHANMWRISGDFWDNWSSLNRNFDLLYRWQGVGGPGHWPDADMIPIGHISIRSVGKERDSKFTPDERKTLMSLWCLAPSPLMLGMSMPQLSDDDLALFTNDEVLAIDQDSLGQPAKRISQSDGIEVWMRTLADGSEAIGIFNRTADQRSFLIDFRELGISGAHRFRDVWRNQDLGTFSDSLPVYVAGHGSQLMRIYDATKAENGAG